MFDLIQEACFLSLLKRIKRFNQKSKKGIFMVISNNRDET